MDILNNIKYIPGRILYAGLFFFFAIFIYGLAFFILYSWFIEPIIKFFKKRKSPKVPAQISEPSPCKKCIELKAECERLKAELKNSEKAHDTEKFYLCQDMDKLKARFENDNGEIVKSVFDDIVLSFIKAKPLAPNVSIEHLTRLCNVPEANDRFFRALLQDFEIQSLTIDKAKNEKHNIKMKLKSGENTYETTLTTCTCRDNYKQNGEKVCKHMYFLALTLGLISSEHYDNFNKCALDFPDQKKIKSLKRNK